MKRILCISDSLGLPRPNVKYEDTWFYKVSKHYPSFDFVSYFRRNGTTDMLSCNGNYDDTLLNYNPQVIILQLGICDCAPRYIRTTSLLYKVLSKTSTSLLSKLSWDIIKMFKKRSLGCTDVDITKFKINLDNYINQCLNSNVEQIIIIKIAIPGDSMINANPLIIESISRYNSIYDEMERMYPDIIKIINPIAVKDNTLFVEDGYHTNSKGHDIITKYLIKVL